MKKTYLKEKNHIEPTNIFPSKKKYVCKRGKGNHSWVFNPNEKVYISIDITYIDIWGAQGSYSTSISSLDRCVGEHASKKERIVDLKVRVLSYWVCETCGKKEMDHLPGGNKVLYT